MTVAAAGHRGVLTLLTCAAGIALLAGCTSREAASPPASPPPAVSTGPSATLEARPVPLEVRVTRLHGRLPGPARRSLERNVGRTLSRYFDDAHLGGEHPRADYGGAFATFTPGAAREARRDLASLTNAELGRSAEGVVPVRKAAWLSVLAPNRVAAGVTARIHLVYVVVRSEGRDQKVRLSGRLLLTRRPSGGWQIFGYDLARSTVPAERRASR